MVFSGFRLVFFVSSTKVRFLPDLPEDFIVDEFFSTVPGRNFDMCIISTRTKTQILFSTLLQIMHFLLCINYA